MNTWHRGHRGDVGRGRREDTKTRAGREDTEGTCHKTGWDNVVADKPSLESQGGDSATRTMKEGTETSREGTELYKSSKGNLENTESLDSVRKGTRSGHFQSCNAQPADQRYLGADGSIPETDGSKRKERASVPPRPLQKKADNPFAPLREQREGSTRRGRADTATVNQLRSPTERHRSEPCKKERITHLFPRARAHPAIHRRHLQEETWPLGLPALK